MRMLSRLLFAGAWAMSGAGVVHASDQISVPVHSSDVAVPVAGSGFDWSGFYAGVYGVARSTDARGTELGVGVEAGVNAQFDFFLVGGEVSLQALTNDTLDTTYGSISGRGGVLITPDVLAYATAGYGMEFGGTGEGDVLAGGGVEFAVNDALSLNAEYTRSFSVEGDNSSDQLTLGARFHF